MGVPAFYRWLSEKYPKIIQDVLEERVELAGDGLAGSVRLPFDATKPNPSGLECDNLYIDMNGIIHPCSHPENGPQPATEEEMYENVCHYVDRLFRAMRPRRLLFLAIDGVAPRAKMNQQRARRFRAAQEAREWKELEDQVRTHIIENEEDTEEATALKQQAAAKKNSNRLGGEQDGPWDSNVITPGTRFMLRLADFIRFYIRKRLATDKAWQQITVLFSDASVPGEGEHKIMNHIRLQRAQPGYNPNLVHVLHGLDADLVMLALASHELHFYISREEVLFGRRSQEAQEQRQQESGFKDAQEALDLAAGDAAMQLPENANKPLQRLSIPILREYLAVEFADCVDPRRLPFQPSLERVIDDFVFMCFFVGNDFLPHLPSLDIRDGALDFLFNVYKRILPGLGDYITNHGGQVNLSSVDVILAEVGAIEDHVFTMKHESEKREEERRKQDRENRKRGRKNDAPPVVAAPRVPTKVKGRSAKILEKNEMDQQALSRGHQAKEEARQALRAKRIMHQDNDRAAQALKESLRPATATTSPLPDPVPDQEASVSQSIKTEPSESETKRSHEEAAKSSEETGSGTKRSHDEVAKASEDTVEVKEEAVAVIPEIDDADKSAGVPIVAKKEEDDDSEDLFADDDEDEPIVESAKVLDPAIAKAFKEKVKAAHQKQLDEHAKNVEDKVRLHEPGWKDRYYTDKCKAEDVSGGGGREHMFRSYCVGLCWVLKYYYEGCPSWKWYYPFHYAPFASDLRNIERFERDCKNFELSKPFNPVEQLMAVLPSDSAHAIPRAAQWLMLDNESPIYDFYPRDVPVDPNGKAMPWLWVVLLPFIDEERLLAAMGPTMKDWSEPELLCNARGLDDGYIFIHKNHALSQKLANVLKNGKTAKSPKTRLSDTASFGSGSVSGSVRPPLSHEIFPLDENAAIPPPPSGSRIDRDSHESIFGEPIDNPDSLCVAFTEPLRLAHKSILLPGTRVPRPCLTAQDKIIRRPRLGRGGTIANMGTNQSHKSGFGSMNIGSYERELANRTGRGHQMYQPGIRTWGSLEPVPKRARQAPVPAPPPQAPNPFMHQGPPPVRAGASSHQPWHNEGHQWHQQPGNQGYGGHPQQQYQPQQQSYNRQNHMQAHQNQAHRQADYQNHGPPRYGNTNHGPSNDYRHVHQQQPPPYYQQGRTGSNGSGWMPQQQPPPPPPPPPPPQQRGIDFRSYNNPSQSSGHPQQGRPHQQHQNAPRSRVNADVMNNLRAQLSSTLNKRSGGNNNNRR